MLSVYLKIKTTHASPRDVVNQKSPGAVEVNPLRMERVPAWGCRALFQLRKPSSKRERARARAPGRHMHTHTHMCTDTHARTHTHAIPHTETPAHPRTCVHVPCGWQRGGSFHWGQCRWLMRPRACAGGPSPACTLCRGGGRR